MFSEDTDKKFRNELKFIISTGQYTVLKQIFSGLMSYDCYAKNGKYDVKSLYFDNFDNKCFEENANSEDPRQKLRIRIYNHSDNLINFEIKQKIYGKCVKYKTEITKEQTELLMQGKRLRNLANNKIIDYINFKMISELYSPKVIVEYTRIPLIHKSSNVRITFDTNITSSKDINGFFNGEIRRRSFMPIGMSIMEIKFDNYIPTIIYDVIKRYNVQFVTFSKYYLARKYSI